MIAATSAFDAKRREAERARVELQITRESEMSANKSLESACDEKNVLVAKSNSLQRTLESLKQDLGRMTRESEKQRCSTRQLRMSLTEAIDDRDKAIAAKEEWREVASLPGSIDKLDKASAKENERVCLEILRLDLLHVSRLRRIISKLTFSLQEKDIQLDAQRATARALQRELATPKRI